MNEHEIKSFLQSSSGVGAGRPAEVSVEETMATAQRALDEAKAAAVKEAEEQAKKKEEAAPADSTQYTFSGIDTPTIRKAIEARLKPFDLDDLLFRGFVTQRVPIIPGRLEVTYRSLSDADSVWCETVALRETMEQHGGLQRVASIRSSRLALALSVMSVNDTAYTPLSVAKSKPSEINDRASVLTAYPAPVLNAMAVNMIWFSNRANKMLSDAVFLGHG